MGPVKDLKAEILLAEKTLAHFSSQNLADAYHGFGELRNLTRQYDRSRGYQFMADYTKNILNNGIPTKWDGSFLLLAK